MKLIYTLILLLFSSSVFADFVDIDSSISDLLEKGLRIEQIDTLNAREYVFHLKHGATIAICYIYFRDTNCMIDTKNKKLLELLKEDDYLERLNKEILAE